MRKTRALRSIRAFYRKHTAAVLLSVCACLTAGALFYAPPSANEEPADSAPSLALVSSGSFPGEAIDRRAYRRDELIWHEALGIWRAHEGADIWGEECAAFSGGRVAAVETDRLWGVCVTVESGEETTVYRSLAESAVSVGDWISEGQILGKTFAAPCEAELGAHAHIERYIGGMPADPF